MRAIVLKMDTAEIRHFTDKKGRDIELRISATLEVCAFDGAKRVGFLDIREVEEDTRLSHSLNYPEVVPEYRRAGIAAELLRFAFEYLGGQVIAIGGPRDRGLSGENARTEEGEAFVQFGIGKGWLFDPYEERELDPDDDQD